MEKHTSRVRIAGHELSLTTQKTEEETQRIAAYLDRKIIETGGRMPVRQEIALIAAALSVTEELYDAQQDNSRLRNELYQLTQKLKSQGMPNEE